MKLSEQKILLVDDEPKIVDAVKAYLEKNNYIVHTAFDGARAVQLFDEVSPDLVILDLMLPSITGEEVCRTIRKKSRIPIIMLTAKTQEDDVINGFNIGADDYITKPFSPRELVVRVGSLLRRSGEGVSPLFNKMSWNGSELEIDFNQKMVFKNGIDAKLTRNEFKLLSTLVKYPKKSFTREELIQIAFGHGYDGYERSIDSHIKNLRNKIEDDSASPKYIITVWGVGYRFGGED